MSTDFAHTVGARQQREEKALALARHLTRWDWDAEQVEAMTDKERRAAERGAGVRRASAETWARVAALMRGGR